MIVPFNRAPYLPEIESAVEAAIRAGALSSNEPFASKVDDHLSRLYGCKVITLSSATHALEAMALLLGISPGDEVVVPSFAFVSTASAFSARGAYIRFVDCDERGNVCPDHLERVVSQKTKAVVVIHYGGTSAPMERILEICSKHRVPVLEDAAQALGVSRNGVPAGTFGDLGCISFQSNKVIASGEGGALIVNHEKWLERAQQIRDKGTNRLQHLNGTASQYTWLEQGSNYGFPGLCAAALLPQLQLLESILQQRRTLWRRYEEALAPTLDRYGIQVIKPTPHETATNAAQFSLLFPGPPRGINS